MTRSRSAAYRLSLTILVSVFALIASCSRPDRSEEALALSDELQNLAFSDMDTALERVDSARRAGLFTSVKANTIKACIYEKADLRRMAAYYAEKAIAAGAGHAITTTADSSDYCTVRWILADVTYANGEYGKSLALAREVLEFTGNSTSPYALAMKCRALSQMADCESELHHLDQAERLLLQSIDILMEDTRQATSFSDIDPIFYSLLSLSDLYIDNGMAARALPLHAKMDTAMNRLTQCPDTPEWVRGLSWPRRNMRSRKACSGHRSTVWWPMCQFRRTSCRRPVRPYAGSSTLPPWPWNSGSWRPTWPDSRWERN